MNIVEFVKNDLKKLGDSKQLFKTIGIIGGLGLMAVNHINEKNNRESMKAEITEEIIKSMTKKD